MTKFLKLHTKSKILFLTAFVALIILGLSNKGKAQQVTEVKKVSRPEKCWAIFHPFKVKIAKRKTREALLITDSINNTLTLDGDISGGQLDAFKHSVWMALLSQQMHWRKARKLGKAHEKGNYITYKKGKRKGRKELPDKVSSDMDYFNNRRGIEIGIINKDAEQGQIIQIILDSIQSGKMRIIKKNSTGEFLDQSDNIIPLDSLEGKWENNKELVPSDYKNEIIEN